MSWRIWVYICRNKTRHFISDSARNNIVGWSISILITMGTGTLDERKSTYSEKTNDGRSTGLVLNLLCET
jgi:hypothetical protein